MIDRLYCMSSFLMYRTVADPDKSFGAEAPRIWRDRPDRRPVATSEELEAALRESVESALRAGKKVALALSGGIDSAILARFLPEGSTAYTFKCVVPGMEVTDESPAAALYAKECGLKHKIIEITWEDCERYAPLLMRRKGAPVHSIEVQIYKAALEAKRDGFDTFLFGENADAIFGGFSQILSRDWTVGDFIDRYSYVLPYKALREYKLVTEPILRHVRDGYVDVHGFFDKEYRPESTGSYLNATGAADMQLLLPFGGTVLGGPLDYERVRRGENKYLVREVFNRLYPGFETPPKLPMPRAVNEWLKDWDGPKRPEFWPHCTDTMTGDQKWLVWALERYLDLLDEDA